MNGGKWERILAPTDFSPRAETAVRYAHGLAEMSGAELHVLHVARNYEELAAEHGVTAVLNQDGQADEFDQWLAGLLGEQGNIRRVEAVRVGTDAAAAINQYAQKCHIDLIVMASHGRTGLSHLLMGSVAEKVMRHAPCPLLVIRGHGER